MTQNESRDAREKQFQLDDISAAMGFQDHAPLVKRQSVAQSRVACQNALNTMLGRAEQAKEDVTDKADICTKLYDSYIAGLSEGGPLHAATEAKQELDKVKNSFQAV